MLIYQRQYEWRWGAQHGSAESLSGDSAGTEMVEERKRANKITDTHKRALAYCHDIKEKYFDKIRDAVDKLELLVDDEDWPLVKYRELLFLR